LDTGCIVAFLDRRERYHQQCMAALSTLTAPLITCEPVLMESCYLLRRVEGANQAILEDVRKRVYQLPHVLADRAAEVAKLLKKYADVPMDLTDACLPGRFGDTDRKRPNSHLGQRLQILSLGQESAVRALARNLKSDGRHHSCRYGFWSR
jgi:predicted nucleic acid-binding protein